MQNKIRLAQEQKVPYMLVLGDREVEARTASPPDPGRRAAARPRRWERLARTRLGRRGRVAARG